MRSDKRLLVGRNVLLQRNRLIIRRYLEPSQRRMNLVDGNVKSLRDKRQIRLQVLDLLPQQIARNRRVIVDQQPPLAIKKLAPRSKNRNLANPVCLRKRPEVLRVQHLQTPQAHQQNRQNQCHQILHSMKLPRRQFFRSAAGSAVLRFGLGGWFHTQSSLRPLTLREIPHTMYHRCSLRRIAPGASFIHAAFRKVPYRSSRKTGRVPQASY